MGTAASSPGNLATYSNVNWTDGVFDHEYASRPVIEKGRDVSGLTDGKEYKDMDSAKKACDAVVVGGLTKPKFGGTGIAFDGTHWYCITGNPPRKCTESAPCATTTWKLKFSKRCVVLHTMPQSDQFLLYHDTQNCISMVEDLSNLDKPRSLNVKTGEKHIRILAYEPSKLKGDTSEAPDHRWEASQVESQRIYSELVNTRILSMGLSVLLIASVYAYVYKNDKK